MTIGALAKHLFSHYSEYRVDHLRPANCRHAEITKEVKNLVDRSDGLLAVEELGASLEGRSIHMIRFGIGAKRILLWSQMHGDEPTATLALMDMLTLIVNRTPDDHWIETILEETTVLIIPMINPDGAERRQRRTAQGVDMNRDAKALRTPEARILSAAHQRLKPLYAFNLHDQELSTVGTSGLVTAVALSAPALDHKKSIPRIRIRAMRVAALISRVMGHLVEGHVAAYDDTYEPRAFGDCLQAGGTSTILLESGHWPGDREKKFIRKLNYVALLSALRAIANGSYQDVDLDHYRGLQPNTKMIFDILIRDVLLHHSVGWSQPVDIGLTIDGAQYQDGANLTVMIKDLGDLSTFSALETIMGGRRRISWQSLTIGATLPLNRLLDELQLYHPTL